CVQRGRPIGPVAPTFSDRNRMPPTTSATAFADLGVADDLCVCLTQRARTEPFPIQAAAIPPALSGQDVSGRAPTASGKTPAAAPESLARTQGPRLAALQSLPAAHASPPVDAAPCVVPHPLRATQYLQRSPYCLAGPDSPLRSGLLPASF